MPGAKPAVGIQTRQETEQFSPVSVQAVHPQTIRVCIYKMRCSYKLLSEGTWCGRAVSARREGFWCECAFLFQITRNVEPLSPHTHLLSSSLAGDTSVSLTSFPAQQAQPLQSFQQGAHCSSVSCQGRLPPALLIPGCSSLPTPNFNFKQKKVN